MFQRYDKEDIERKKKKWNFACTAGALFQHYDKALRLNRHNKFKSPATVGDAVVGLTNGVSPVELLKRETIGHHDNFTSPSHLRILSEKKCWTGVARTKSLPSSCSG